MRLSILLVVAVVGVCAIFANLEDLTKNLSPANNYKSRSDEAVEIEVGKMAHNLRRRLPACKPNGNAAQKKACRDDDKDQGDNNDASNDESGSGSDSEDSDSKTTTKKKKKKKTDDSKPSASADSAADSSNTDNDAPKTSTKKHKKKKKKLKKLIEKGILPPNPQPRNQGLRSRNHKLKQRKRRPRPAGRNPRPPGQQRGRKKDLKKRFNQWSQRVPKAMFQKPNIKLPTLRNPLKKQKKKKWDIPQRGPTGQAHLNSQWFDPDQKPQYASDTTKTLKSEMAEHNVGHVKGNNY